MSTTTTTAEMKIVNGTTAQPYHTISDAGEEKGFEATIFAAQEEGGGGASVGAIAGIIIAVVIILAALILLFVKTRNRNRPVQAYNNYPSQKQSLFALSSTKQQPQYLPTYIQPSSPYAQHHHGGLAMPQAVHPNSTGYYTQAGQGQADDRVRFGSVGVVRY